MALDNLNIAELQQVTEIGNPWHGRFTSATNLLLENGTNKTVPSGTNRQSNHYVNGGFPNRAPSNDLAALGGKWYGDAILYGMDKKYSPLSSLGIGAEKWIYFDANGVAWLLKSERGVMEFISPGDTEYYYRVNVKITLVGRMGAFTDPVTTPCNTVLYNQNIDIALARSTYQVGFINTDYFPIGELFTHPNGSSALMHLCCRLYVSGSFSGYYQEGVRVSYDVFDMSPIARPVTVLKIDISGIGSLSQETLGVGISASVSVYKTPAQCTFVNSSFTNSGADVAVDLTDITTYQTSQSCGNGPTYRWELGPIYDVVHTHTTEFDPESGGNSVEISDRWNLIRSMFLPDGTITDLFTRFYRTETQTSSINATGGGTVSHVGVGEVGVYDPPSSPYCAADDGISGGYSQNESTEWSYTHYVRISLYRDDTEIWGLDQERKLFNTSTWSIEYSFWNVFYPPLNVGNYVGSIEHHLTTTENYSMKVNNVVIYETSCTKGGGVTEKIGNEVINSIPGVFNSLPRPPARITNIPYLMGSYTDFATYCAIQPCSVNVFCIAIQMFDIPAWTAEEPNLFTYRGPWYHFSECDPPNGTLHYYNCMAPTGDSVAYDSLVDTTPASWNPRTGEVIIDAYAGWV